MGSSGNLVDLVVAAARRGPDHLALVEPVRELALSWSATAATVDAEAARLVSAGVRPGDRVLVRLRQGIPLCVALLGALRADAVVVPVGTQSTERELGVIAADCAPVVSVAEDGDPLVAAVAGAGAVLGPPRLPAGSRTAGAAGAAGAGAPGTVREGDLAAPTRGGEDIALLGYTSGTTGRPRGVRLSHRALLANRAQTGALRPNPISPADRVLLHLPLFHIYGLGAGLLQVCWAGATGVLVDQVEPEEVLAAVRRERVTVVAGVPSMFRALLEVPRERLRADLETVRLCTAGGAPLSRELLARFREESGLELFEGYGMTETGPILTSTLVAGRAKPGSVGRPLPGIELRLVDPSTGQPLDGPGGPVDADDRDDCGDRHHRDDEEPGADGDGHDTGLVSVRGENLFSGYWPDGADGPDDEGWFRTSDVGYLDADGDLYLVDRAGDLIIVNGFNVYPREVEQVVGAHPSVAEAAVVGVPDQRTGEAVMAVLVLAPGAELTAEQVREHCAVSLARYKVPTVVEIVDRLPRSATGKITRGELRASPRSVEPR